MSDNDLIRRGDALAAVQEWTYCCDAEEAIAALPAVTVGVKPLVWEHDGTCFRAVDPVTGQTRLAMDAERAAASDAERAARILAALDLPPAPDAAALAVPEVAAERSALLVKALEEIRDNSECGFARHRALAALRGEGGQ